MDFFPRMTTTIINSVQNKAFVACFARTFSHSSLDSAWKTNALDYYYISLSLPSFLRHAAFSYSSRVNGGIGSITSTSS